MCIGQTTGDPAWVEEDARARAYRREGYWTDRLLTDFFEAALERSPGKVAVKDDRFGSLTYGELAPMAWRLAAALRQRGVAPGDRFVVALPNWNHVTVFVLALTYIGAVAVHMPVMQGGHEFFGILKITEAKGIVVPGEFRGTDFVSLIGGMAGKLESLETLATVGRVQRDPGWATFEGLLAEAPGDAPRPVPPITASDLTLVLFTSGSAGDPKGVMHSSNTICALNTTVAPIYGLGSEDVIFMAAPLGFSAGYVHGLRLAIYLGATLVLQESWNADRALRTMVREKATFTLTTPTLLRDLMASPLFASHAARLSLRLVLCGGTYVPADLLRAAHEGMPGTLTSVIWGMTEGIGTGSRPGTPPERVRETDGQPFLGTELKVLAEDGGEAGPGEEGDLVMRGPQLCLGYFKRPEVDADTFLPGRWLRTGDVARIDAEGFVKITGRRKELIIRGGANLSPAEIESMLLGDPRIRELAVVGLPDERLGERVCACVVPGEGGGDLTLSDIVEIARRRGLAKYKWPESLAFVDALPVSTVGKLQRRVLQERVMKRIEAAGRGET